MRARRSPMLAAVAATALLVSGCAEGRGDLDAGRPRVVAALYPLAYAARAVGGDAVRVEMLTPAAADPHDVELSFAQLRALSGADLVVYAGRGLQPAVEDAVAWLGDTPRVDAVAYAHLGSRPGGSTDPSEPHASGHHDAHVWLDPTIMASIGRAVAARLGEIDPARAALYRTRAERFAARLRALDEDLAAGLAPSRCRTRAFVTSHEAFGFLAARYGLESVSVGGLDPELEPSPAQLARTVRFVTARDVTTVFVDERAPRAVARVLASETGATLAVLSALETPPTRGDYVDAMRANLRRLREALGCG